jgi:multidrug resistance protein MdtO
MAAISQPLIDKEPGPGTRFWQFLKRELAPFPGRLSASIRVTIAALIVTLLGEVGRSEALFLALFVLLSLPRDFPRQTWNAALQILATVWCAVLAGLLLDTVVADLRVLRVISLGVVVFFCLIIGRGMRQPLVGILSAVILSTGLIQWDAVSDPETNVEFMLWQGLMISTGVLTATVVEYLYPHPSPLQRVVRGIADRFDVLHCVLRRLSGEGLSARHEEQIQNVRRLAVTGVGSLQAFLPGISANNLLDENYLIRLSSLLMGIEVLTEIGARLNDFSAADFNENQRQRLAELSAQSDYLAERIRHQDDTNSSNQPEPEAKPFADNQSPSILLGQVELLLNRLWNIWYSQEYFIGDVEKRLLHPSKKSLPLGPFFTPDNVQFAFKTAMASMICYLIYNGVGWPGIGTSVVTCFIVAMDTVGATFRKLFLRLAGSAIGGLLFGIGGISLVLSNMTNVVELLLVVAVVFFISGWVVKGSQRISYAGVQIGLSFALVAMSRPEIPYEIAEARDRFVGVLLGAVVMWYTFRQFWRVNAVVQQRMQIAGLVRKAADLGAIAQGDQPSSEKAARVREIRMTTNQAIFLTNEQADSAGFDSHYNSAVQASLRECLRRAEALVLLEFLDAGVSVTRPLPPLPEAIIQARHQFSLDYPKFLYGVADQIVRTDKERQGEQLREHTAEWLKLSRVLSEQAQIMRESDDPEVRQFGQIKKRVFERREEFTRQLTDSVHRLLEVTPLGG